MQFLIQDLLDFAQIKAGKFRKNVKVFNIRNAIKDVMSIQRLKAEKNGIDLQDEYENITGENEVVGNDQFSPYIKSDEQRIQQILLNL